MPGQATTGGPSKVDPQEPSTADYRARDTAVAGAPEAANQLEEGCSSGVNITCHQGGSRPDPAMVSAAELQLDKTAPGGDGDVISVTSSVPALHVKETLENDGDDEVISIGSYGRRGPPAASLVPAVKAMMVSKSGDIGDIVIDLEDSEDAHVPGGQSAPAGRAASSAQASSKAKPVKGAAEAQRSLQVLCHIQMQSWGSILLSSRIGCHAGRLQDSVTLHVALCPPVLSRGPLWCALGLRSPDLWLGADCLTGSALTYMATEKRCDLTLLLLQAEHHQVLLATPGIRPAAICLFREGDVDWLSYNQICTLLLNKPKVRRRANESETHTDVILYWCSCKA